MMFGVGNAQPVEEDSSGIAPRRARRAAWGLAVLCAFCLAGRTTQAANWRWELSNDDYRKMNAFERAQYDKAAKQFRDRSYRAASSEFEKFKIQFPDSENLPYVLFMIGYSSHLDKKRYKAIQIYNEVLDYFGDVINQAAPALYFMGIAYIENGDVREGMMYLKELVEDEDYRVHALAAGALRRLADNEWKNKNEAAAVRYWKQVVRDFAATNQDEARIARENVTACYVKSQGYPDYEAWRVSEENREDPKHRRGVVDHAWHVAYHGFRHEWGKYTNFNREEKVQDMKAFYTWLALQQTWYEQAEDPWAFYHNALLFVSHRLHDRKETRTLLDKAMPLVKNIADERQRNDRFAWLADRLREGRDFENALFCLTYMTDPPYATYKEYEILAGQGKWAEGIKRLEDVEGMGKESWTQRAVKERARIYKDVLHKYETAVSLYQQINEPPWSLWAVQDCYRHWGKLQEALGVLTEIEASFPDDASNAAWHKARYLHESGRSKEAIAAARRVLKVYPNSSASSSAHQLLEKYGVDTGGAVLEDG